MQPVVDRSSPIPLYHQIAEALRYQIATARLRSGDSLPSVRDAALIWKVNLHTVRRAYRELAEAGVVEIRPPHAARVVGGGGRRRGGKLERFLDSIAQTAAEKHGLDARELSSLLLDRSAKPSRRGGIVHVIECSEIQAAGHAREIERSWDVRAEPWSLEREGDAPAGSLVATYFHYNDIRLRWPRRLPEIHFAGIHPDPTLPARLPRPRGGRRLTLHLLELDRPLAESVAADLTILLPPQRYRVVPEVVKNPGRRLARGGKGTFLLPPRVWNLLTPKQRMDGRAVEVPYVFEPRELEAIGRHFEWRRKG